MSNDTIEQEAIEIVDSGSLAALNKSEIDQQIATAKRWPRSVKQFRDEVRQMATLNEHVAGECIYAIPRDGKTIEGPSARFAEVALSAWGNSRAGARVIAEDAGFVTAQGAFFDMERNVAISYEVRRRITDKKGKRFSPDMIAVTANAACSIALRNAILKGVPKAFWADLYEETRRCAAGDARSLATRRDNAVKAFAAYGVGEDRILAVLGVAGREDVTLDHLATLKGILTAIKEGEITPEVAFPVAAKADEAQAAAEATASENKGAVIDARPEGGAAAQRAAEPTAVPIPVITPAPQVAPEVRGVPMSFDGEQPAARSRRKSAKPEAVSAGAPF